MQRLISISCNATDSDRAFCAEFATRITAIGCELAGCDEDLLNLKNSQSSEWPAVAANTSAGYGPLPIRAFLIDGFADAHLTATDAAVRRQARTRIAAILALAAEHDIPRVTLTPAIVHPHHPQSTTYAAALNHTVEALSRLAPHAETAGVQLCVRLSTHGFLTSPPEAREILDAIASPAIAADLALAPEARSDQCDSRDWLQTLERHVGVIALSFQSSDRVSHISVLGVGTDTIADPAISSVDLVEELAGRGYAASPNLALVCR